MTNRSMDFAEMLADAPLFLYAFDGYRACATQPCPNDGQYATAYHSRCERCFRVMLFIEAFDARWDQEEF